MQSRERPAITRRDALGAFGAAALAGTLARSGPSFAQPAAARDASAPAPEMLIRGGYVLSMDPQIGDLPIGDVHLRDGTVVAVGESLDAPQADVLDAANTIVMPGFVETHWHMWTSLWRGIANDASDYFALQALRAHYVTQDHYTAVLYASLEALNAGITTVHNWAHGTRNFDDAEAEMRALVDAGLRARMGYPGTQGDRPTPRAELERALDWIGRNGEGRLSLGMLLDGAGEHLVAQVGLGRQLGLKTITDHNGLLANPDLLGPDVLVTHGTGLTQEDIELIATRGANVGLCPGTDPMIGAGLPPIASLLAGGVPLDRISFTVDVTAQTPADPFEMLRTLVNAGRIQQAGTGDLVAIAQARHDWDFSYRDALALGTHSGASVLGIDDQVGSLTPGKRADVIVVRMDAINMLPAPDTNPTYQLVQHGQPANVDTVIVDGRIRKRAGRLIDVDVGNVAAAAAAAQSAIRGRAGLPPTDRAR